VFAFARRYCENTFPALFRLRLLAELLCFRLVGRVRLVYVFF